ncbi:MAG TPA: ELWxxDGT repeat protein [Thermoanaerobaculia bacterium]|nr:ELWxxDGT repeat protein [Thermoanaerobaculia bacterium]
MARHGIIPAARSRVLSVLVVLSLPAALCAQPAFRVKDLNTTAPQGGSQLRIPARYYWTEGSAVQEAVDVSGTAFFSVGDGIHGIELWKSDGTEAGSQLVRDICPGACSSRPKHLTAVGNNLFFTASDGVHGHELWKSDGTEAGTVRLTDLAEDSFWGPEIVAVTNAGNVAIFDLKDVFDHHLWRSDGTLAGTFLLKTFGVINDNDPLIFLPSLGNSVLFWAHEPATDAQYGRELWTTDGTVTGTVLLKDIYPGPVSSNRPFWQQSSRIRHAALLNGRVYFFATTYEEGDELWASDGTEAGTVLVKDIAPGGGGSFPDAFTIRGSEVFFTASGPDDGKQIWKTDGTGDGTVQVTALGINSTFQPPTAAGGLVYFFYDDGVHGNELWKTDGTGAGTALVKDVWPGSGSSVSLPYDFAFLADVGGKLIFFAQDGVHGREPWVSDGTEAGTVLLDDLFPGSPGSFPTSEPSVEDRRAVSGGRFFFRAYRDFTRLEMWTSDGAPGSTERLETDRQASAFHVLPTGSLAGPSPMFDLSGVLLFPGGDGATGAELARSDGTEAGTFVIRELAGGDAPSLPHEFTRAGDQVFFRATRNWILARPFVESLWTTDGTAAGTVPLYEILTTSVGGSPLPPRDLTAAGGKLFFAGQGTSPVADVLWTSDGTPAGTVKVQDGTTEVGLDVHYLAALGDRVFFLSEGQSQDEELWVSDGTNAGTFELEDIEPQAFNASRPGFFTVLGGNLYFSAKTLGAGRELWKTDGTADGTSLVKDVNPSGNSLGDPYFDVPGPRFVAAGSTLFFDGGSAPGQPSELWKSDGTAPGTVLVKALPGPRPRLRNLTAVGRRVYFTFDDGTHGEELWVSDGTPDGTRLVEDVFPGPDSSLPQELRASGHLLLFSATDGAHGREPWRSNGRAAGTFEVQDIAPGPLSSSPLSFTASGPNVYFAANDNETGFELWAAPRASLAATFGDVPASHWAWPQIEALAQAGITSGCGTGEDFCPERPVTRAEMAIFLGRALHGADFIPVPATGTRFTDIPAGHWAGAWIEQIARDGVTQGCTLTQFCPATQLTRAEMAVFLLRARHGGNYNPPPVTGTRFTDVPANHWAAAWIEQLAAEGITNGCTAGTYCPGSVLSRAEMAVFLTRTFSLETP